MAKKDLILGGGTGGTLMANRLRLFDQAEHRLDERQIR